jgi:hypothetical protein
MQARPIFGGPVISNHSSVPSAFVDILGNSTYYDESPKVLMPELGNCPVRLVGCQPMADVYQITGNASLFNASTGATLFNGNTIQISPDTLNGPIAAKANFYARYVIRDLLLEFVTFVATTQAGGFSLSLREKGDTLDLASSFSSNRLITPSVTLPYRAERTFLHYHYGGPQLYYCKQNSTSEAGKDLTCQLLLQGWPAANGASTTSMGFINVYYVIDLYSPYLSQNITVTISDEETKFVRRMIEDFRRNKAMLVSDDEYVEADAKSEASFTLNNRALDLSSKDRDFFRDKSTKRQM